MKEVYVLMCQVWGGSSYSTEVVKVYKDEETAHRTALAYQGRTPKCDISYYVEKCEYEDFEP